MREYFYINCDGGARGNPGPAASAFVVKKSHKIIFEYNQFIGKATNNMAEYKGVIAALSWVNTNGKMNAGDEIIFLLDSELVTKQLLGLYKTKNPILKKMLESAKLLEQRSANKISYKLIPREKNKDADFLVNEILNDH